MQSQYQRLATLFPIVHCRPCGYMDMIDIDNKVKPGLDNIYNIYCRCVQRSLEVTSEVTGGHWRSLEVPHQSGSSSPSQARVVQCRHELGESNLVILPTRLLTLNNVHE